MKFTINTEEIADGTPTRTGLPPPTPEELGTAWKALLLVAQKLGKATEMVEVLRASFRWDEHETQRHQGYFTICFNAVLVVPAMFPEKKVKIDRSFKLIFLRDEMDCAMQLFLRQIQSQIRGAILKAHESANTMSDMLSN